MKKVIEYFSSRGMITNWLILLVMVAGIFGFSQLRRRVWPQMDYDYINLDIAWPGASPLEIEDGLTIPVEERLKGIDGIERTVTTTGEGYLNAWIEASPDVAIDKVVDRIRSSIETIPNYPEDARAPRVAQLDSWNRVMLLFIYGPEDMDVLQSVADDFRTDLIATGSVSQLQSWGVPGKEIRINTTPALLREYNLEIADIGAAIAASDMDVSAGEIVTGQEILKIRSYSRKKTVEDLRSVPIPVGGRTIPLGQLCLVEESRPEEAVVTRANGQPAVGFNIMYTNTEDVLAISETVDALIAESEARYDGLVTFHPFIRDSDQIGERLGTLATSGLMGLILVVLVLGFFLNLRLSLWVAFGIPFSFLGLFFIEWTLGITINEMSLFGMIMVLGILVDDGIVIGENIFSHWKDQGKTPLKAAIDGTREVIGPVVISIVTTMVAFAPYFFLYGEMGQYTSQIGLVIILCLAFSLIEAAIILPVHLSHSRALKARGGAQERRIRQGLDRFQAGLVNTVYAPVLRFSLKHRGVSLAFMVAVILVLVGAMAGNHVKAVFFPNVETPYGFAQISFPSGTSAAVVNSVQERFTKTALELGREEEWALPELGYDNAIQEVLSWGDNSSLTIYFILIPNEERPYPTSRFSTALSNRLEDMPEVESIKLAEDGGMGGSPISVRFVGKNSQDLEKAATLLKEEIAKIEGVRDISDNLSRGARELSFQVNETGKALGFSIGSIAGKIRDGWYGREVARVNQGPRQIPVVIRMDPQFRQSLNQLDRYPLRSPAGGWTMAGDVIDYSVERGAAKIRRENGFRSVSVNAAFDSEGNDLNVVLTKINSEIVPQILEQVPSVSQSMGGQAEAVNRMAKSMVTSMVVAMIVMFTILMFGTGSFSQALVIMLLIPLGLVGAILGHMVMGQPLSFLSFLGVVALAGIIVNDSVVLIATFNRLRWKEGLSGHEAAYQAGLKRFRPIVMTTITTAVGLGPLIFQKSMGGQFLVPMAISIAYGLIFGTFLTLVLLPCVLSLLDSGHQRRLKRKEKRLGRQESLAAASQAALTL
ncbi:MAG: efflux RND transporter permease subunit [Spirochaetales bacterium]|nr:efflux RND transporter permease subunit [Spirochaetales bacterium]